MNATATHILLLAIAVAATAGSALAEPVPIAHPSGASLVVKTIDLGAASIVLSVTISNPGDREIRLNHGRSFVLDDRVSGVHHLNPPADNPELRIPARAQLDGDLVFIGPLAPSAYELTLANDAFRATLPLAESSGASDIYQADHPDGVALRVRRIRAAGAACAVSLLATNGSDRTVVLNQKHSLVLTDGHGVAALLKAPAENRELVVPAGNRLDADLVFDCRSIDTSAPLVLSTNRGTGGTADNPDDTLPVFTLTPAVERRADAAPPLNSRATVAPIAWSYLSASAAMAAAAASVDWNPATTPPPAAADPPPAGLLRGGAPDPVPPNASSPPSVEQLEAALHAKKTERGLRLALPADRLFGSAPTTLDAAADPLLAPLAELIAATNTREVIVTVHPGSASKAVDNKVSTQRARAVVAWLEGHAPKPPPRFVARGYGGPRPAAPNDNAGDPDSGTGTARDPWVDVILRRDHLVPNKRSPASPSPGRI